MSEDWQPGDLALCVESNWENLDPSDHDPRHGGLHIVKRVVERRGHAGLVFAEFRYAYLASCFRRIAPLTEPERCAALADFKATSDKEKIDDAAHAADPA